MLWLSELTMRDWNVGLSCSRAKCAGIVSFNPNQYTWGPRGPQAYVLCDILRSVRYFFAKLYVFLTPSYVIIVTKYHLLYTILRWGLRGPQAHQF